MEEVERTVAVVDSDSDGVGAAGEVEVGGVSGDHLLDEARFESLGDVEIAQLGGDTPEEGADSAIKSQK